MPDPRGRRQLRRGQWIFRGCERELVSFTPPHSRPVRFWARRLASSKRLVVDAGGLGGGFSPGAAGGDAGGDWRARCPARARGRGSAARIREGRREWPGRCVGAGPGPAGEEGGGHRRPPGCAASLARRKASGGACAWRGAIPGGLSECAARQRPGKEEDGELKPADRGGRAGRKTFAVMGKRVVGEQMRISRRPVRPGERGEIEIGTVSSNSGE